MLYNDFHGLSVSALGLGCMRLPLNSQDETDINESAVAEMVKAALENGINYFDTAWRYHGGNSETVMGRVLSSYPRESYYIASTFPGFSVETMEKPAAILRNSCKNVRSIILIFIWFIMFARETSNGYLIPNMVW